MIACLHETMRIYPPVGAGLPRIVPRGAEVVIAGHVVPGDTNVAIPPYALNHCAGA
ncbi:hypothetical protein QBC46DRAFT_435168 [Diplogelasinospora grovesii]|uniref:Uncharacterized protein n=1 Tax=Diplogelasinospora grovesii TaxID=303347 RepID=A0AAN6MU22_9PEZI|nr:hypothetical protein QBC46DRAFT_435168 [Diplogelasinospora grovesii]